MPCFPHRLAVTESFSRESYRKDAFAFPVLAYTRMMLLSTIEAPVCSRQVHRQLLRYAQHLFLYRSRSYFFERDMCGRLLCCTHHERLYDATEHQWIRFVRGDVRLVLTIYSRRGDLHVRKAICDVCEGEYCVTRRDSANDDKARPQPDDAIAMLTADHRQVRTLFQQYADTPDPYLQQIIAEHVFAELTLHMLLEETVFYPAVAEQADTEGKQLVSEALQDHQHCRALIENLQETDDDTAFEAGFQALRAQVDQHVEDEETRMFPEAAQVLATHWEEITALLQERKAQLLAS